MILVLCAALGVVPAGCGRSTSNVISRYDKMFESADPTARTKWDQARTAMESRDYVDAMMALESMHFQTKLTHEQVVAIDEALEALLVEMTEAARQGNTKARQALEEQSKLREPAGR